MYDPTRPQLDFERTLEIEASLSSSERNRAELIRQEFRVALARQFPRLPKMITDALTRDCIGDKEVFLSIVGASGGPSSDADFDHLVREIVLSDELAVDAINLADDTAIRCARDDALAALSPAQRIAKERDGRVVSLVHFGPPFFLGWINGALLRHPKGAKEQSMNISQIGI